MRINYRVTSCNSQHCKVTIFIEGQMAGSLVFTPSEWLLFSTAQLIAKDEMVSGGHYNYIPQFDDAKYSEFVTQQKD